jgi:AraC-like DNA-binding protein
MGSFRNRIVWIVVIALGVTLTSFLAVTRQEVNRQNMEMTRNLTEQIIEAKSAQISGWMEQRIVEIQVLTESELLRSMDMRRIKPYMRAFDAQHDESFESFGICDEAGMMWISDDTMIDIGDREYFQRIQETGADFVISDPIISKSNEEPIVIIHHRIFGENKETLGHVNAAIRLSKLSELASEVVVEDGQGWLVDGSGHIFTPTQAGYEVTELEAFQTLSEFVVRNQQGVRVQGQDGQEKPQIALVDINMPEMNGLEMIENLRSILPNTLVVILSGYDQFDYAQQGIRLGVLDYLLKPVDREELFMVLRDAGERVAKNTIEGVEKIADDLSLAQQARVLLEGSFTDAETTLNGIAASLHVSASSLTRSMQKEFGMSFGEYITSLRIEKACLLLMSTEQKMYEVAENCGYGSQHYFSRVFRKQRGETPQAYRKSNKKKE